jgi:hypothetical protein
VDGPVGATVPRPGLPVPVAPSTLQLTPGAPLATLAERATAVPATTVVGPDTDTVGRAAGAAIVTVACTGVRGNALAGSVATYVKLSGAADPGFGA